MDHTITTWPVLGTMRNIKEGDVLHSLWRIHILAKLLCYSSYSLHYLDILQTKEKSEIKSVVLNHGRP